MLDEAVLNDCFMLKYFVGRYKIQEMSDTTIDDFLPASRLILRKTTYRLKCFFCDFGY